MELEDLCQGFNSISLGVVDGGEPLLVLLSAESPFKRAGPLHRRRTGGRSHALKNKRDECVDPTLDLGAGVMASSSPERPGALLLGTQVILSPGGADDGSSSVVPRTESPMTEAGATECQRSSTRTRLPADKRWDSCRMAWADLLQRVFEIDALRCPGCGARMRIHTDPRGTSCSFPRCDQHHAGAIAGQGLSHPLCRESATKL